jgi:hypothetical protein
MPERKSDSRGRSNRLVGQVGEFLVCAELGRRGLIATPFAGNVPGFDVIAVGENLRSIPIQVKTADGGAWQCDSTTYLRIDYDEATQRQDVRGLKEIPNADLIMVFVWLAQQPNQRDRFFLCRRRDVAQLVYEEHTSFLQKHGGRRPRKPESTHSAIRTDRLKSMGFEDDWSLVLDAVGHRSATTI